MRNAKNAGLCFIVALTGIAVSAWGAKAETTAEFYKSKSIKMIVASGPGGGYDTYARELIPFMKKHLPGHPNFIVQYMPGAGGIAAVNFVYNIAPKDGSVILAAQRDSLLAPIMGGKRIRFDPSKLGWIGSLNSETAICGVWRTAKVQTFKDLLTTQLIIAGNGPNSSEFIPAFLNATVGTKFKLISGYPDGTTSSLAVERGEVEGWCGMSYSSLKSSHPDWLKDGKIKVLIQANLVKNPNLPDVPFIMDIAPDAKVKQMMEVLLAPQYIGRPYAAPPGLPANRLNALRAAFDASTADPALAATLKKRRRPFSPASGKEIQQVVNRIYSVSPEVIAKLKDSIKYKGVVVKAKIHYETVKGKITRIRNKGARIYLTLEDGKKVSANISRSRTAIEIGAKKGKRGDFKVGMSCSVTYPGPRTQAKKVSCK